MVKPYTVRAGNSRGRCLSCGLYVDAPGAAKRGLLGKNSVIRGQPELEMFEEGVRARRRRRNSAPR